MVNAAVLLTVLLVAEIIHLVMNAGVVAEWSERADWLKVYARAEREDSKIFPGNIYDRNGTVIAETDYFDETEKLEDGTEQTKKVRKTQYTNGKAYSQLVGYTGRRQFNFETKEVSEMIGDRDDYRLMSFLDDEEYWGENGLYSTVDQEGTRGQSAVLTIDHELQEAVYQALSNQMSEKENIGSALVMDAKTGEILSMVSFPAYDFNDLPKAKEKMGEDAANTRLEPYFPVTYKNAETPGSIFKVLTSVALIDHGMEDYTVENTSFTVNDWVCEAHGYFSGSLAVELGETLDMEKALNISSNVYFAQAALDLGADKLNETAEKFMLKAGTFTDADGDGKDDTDGHEKKDDTTYLGLDFGNVQYNWDLDVEDDVLAQTGFGQGRTELTTVYAAMMTQAIANDGRMMKPWLIKQLVDADGETVYEGSEELLSQATVQSTAARVREYMRSCAVENCNVYGLYDAKEVFDRYQVAGKTGTAENGDEHSTDNAWYISMAPADDPQYVVVVNQCKSHKFGYQMINTAAEIYSYLFMNAE